MEKTNYGNI